VVVEVLAEPSVDVGTRVSAVDEVELDPDDDAGGAADRGVAARRRGEQRDQGRTSERRGDHSTARVPGFWGTWQVRGEFRSV
jgi:hypothetical protein